MSKADTSDDAVKQPDELSLVKDLVAEFVKRACTIDSEIECLKEDRKDLVKEFKEKLDMKTLTAALRVVKIQNAVGAKDTFDMFVEVLTNPAT